ncbi:MAG: hypothetical protein LBT92_01855 [Rickettsiales bacterium]|jgi:hypothetical protein|nr:hypothetical protein [Rickettsiales bacterium]
MNAKYHTQKTWFKDESELKSHVISKLLEIPGMGMEQAEITAGKLLAKDLSNYLFSVSKKDSSIFDFCGKIQSTAERFKSEGLTISDYLKAAVKQPSLFYQSPETVAGHINMLIDMRDRGLFDLRGANLMHRICSDPSHTITIANENLQARDIACQIGKNAGHRVRPFSVVFVENRPSAEGRIISALGKDSMAVQLYREFGIIKSR